MSRPKAEYRVGVGASSIMMILVVLAMTALSLLSFSSAHKAEVMGKRNLTMITAYYEAAAKVQQKLAVMNDIFAEAETGLADEANPTAAKDSLGGNFNHNDSASAMRLYAAALSGRGLTDVTLEAEQEDLRFAFSIDAGYERVIMVKGIISPGKNPRHIILNHELRSLQTDDEEWEYSLWHAFEPNEKLTGDE